MSKQVFLLDGFKPEVLKLIETTAFKELLRIARNRTPNFARNDDQLHNIAASAKMREGYEMALDNIENLVHESEPKTILNEMEAALLDPRD